MGDLKNIKDELNDLGSSLARREKKNNFSVPENYFENLNSIVQDKIAATRKQRWQERVFVFLFQQKLVLASLLIVIIFGSVYYFKNAGNTILPFDNTQQELALTDDDVNALAAELDEHTVTEFYAQSISASTENSNTEIEEYLIDNNIDVNSLINEL
jgi:hypothetical protein